MTGGPITVDSVATRANGGIFNCRTYLVLTISPSFIYSVILICTKVVSAFTSAVDSFPFDYCAAIRITTVIYSCNAVVTVSPFLSIAGVWGPVRFHDYRCFVVVQLALNSFLLICCNWYIMAAMWYQGRVIWLSIPYCNSALIYDKRHMHNVGLQGEQ